MYRFFGIYHKNARFLSNVLLQDELRSFHKITHNKLCIYYDQNNSSRGGSNNQVYEDAQFISVFIGRLVIETESGSQVIHHSSVSSSEWKRIIEQLISNIEFKELNIKGEFVLMIYDKRIEKIVIIGDQFGFRPFYFQLSSEYFAFGSDISFLKLLNNDTLKMDPIWIADSISTIRSGSDITPYFNISKLKPASVLEYKLNLTIWNYWNLELKVSLKDMSFEESSDLFRLRLKAAIEDRLVSSQRIGSELSGGLDSSGLTALAYKYSQDQNKPFYAFSHVLSESRLGKDYPFSDERKFSTLLIEHIELENHIFCTAEDYGIIHALKESINNHSGPTQLAYDIFSDVIYDRAKRYSVDTLLSGFGGDEGVSFSANVFFKELIDRNRRKKYIEEHSLKSNDRYYRRSKAFINYLSYKYFPISRTFLNDLVSRKYDWRKAKFETLALEESFSWEMGIKDRYFKQKATQAYRDVRSDQMNRISSNHIPQRLEYSYFSAKAKGIDYVYPLLDVDLLELYYSLPSEFKFRNGTGRAIFREVLKDVIPEELRLREDKSLHTIPAVHHRISHDYELIKSLILLSERHNKYHYLDYEKMLNWLNRICDHTFNDNNPNSPQAFINSIQILILQELERNGEFRSGIKF